MSAQQDGIATEGTEITEAEEVWCGRCLLLCVLCELCGSFC